MSAKVFIGILSLAILLAFGYLFFEEYGFYRRIELNSQIDSLKSEIAYSEKTIKKLNSEIDSLKNNYDKIERVAREKYNFRKANEKVIDVEIR